MLAGALIFQVCRYETGERAPDASERDGWNWKVKDARQVPDRLPELIDETKPVAAKGSNTAARIAKGRATRARHIAPSVEKRRRQAHPRYAACRIPAVTNFGR